MPVSANALSAKRVLSERENDLVKLRKAHKTLLTRVKTAQTKLDTLKHSLAHDVGATMSTAQAQAMEQKKLNEEFRDVLLRCIQSPLFKKERYLFQELLDGTLDLLDELADMMGLPPNDEEKNKAFEQISPEELEAMMPEMMEQMGDEDFMNNRAKGRFGQFRVDVPESQQQNAKEIFKRLAIAFHPDKVAHDKHLEAKYHAIMQRVNEAFQRGDMAALLELERELSVRSDILAGETAPIADLVEQEIARMQREISLCKDQLDRMKRERTLLERTPEGKYLKEINAMKKSGYDPQETMLAEHTIQIKTIAKSIETLTAALAGTISKKEVLDYMDKTFGQEEPSEIENISFEEFIAAIVGSANQPQSRSGGGRSKKSMSRDLEQLGDFVGEILNRSRKSR